VTAEATDGFVRVTVSDTGIGIPQARFVDVFRPFERLETSDAALAGGTGLGLSITKQLVELLGGEISLASQLGAGTQVSFTIPVAPADAVAPVPGAPGRRTPAPPAGTRAGDPVARPVLEADRGTPAEAGAGPQKTRILIVDDEPVNLQVLSSQLSREKYEVQQATNGPDALEACRKERPDLVLLDVMMPRMDGYEVCQRIRRMYPLAELPIIMLTAKDQVGDLVAGLAAGATDFVPKPFSRRELAARIRTQLELSKATHTLGRFVPREFLGILESAEGVLAEMGITRRERDVLEQLLCGYGIPEISDRLFVSRRTVEKHVEHLYLKMGVKSRHELRSLVSGWQKGAAR
jgi:two-component system sensor histidine kinase ChiS